MDLHGAIEYLWERRNAEYAAETTDWTLVEAIENVLTALGELGVK